MEYTHEEIAELRKESTFVSKLIGLSRVTLTKILRNDRNGFSNTTLKKVDIVLQFRAKQNKEFKAFITDFQLQK